MYERMVEAYAKSTSKKQRIPAHWLDHPVLGSDFELTPSGREQQRRAEAPDDSWHVPELEQFADAHGIDRKGLRKPELLDAITAHLEAAAPQTPGDLVTDGQDDDTDGTPQDPTTSDGDPSVENQE